jgi:hypothetical protein
VAAAPATRFQISKEDCRPARRVVFLSRSRGLYPWPRGEWGLLCRSRRQLHFLERVPPTDRKNRVKARPRRAVGTTAHPGRCDPMYSRESDRAARRTFAAPRLEVFVRLEILCELYRSHRRANRLALAGLSRRIFGLRWPAWGALFAFRLIGLLVIRFRSLRR